MISQIQLRSLSAKVPTRQGTLKQRNSTAKSSSNRTNSSWRGEISEAYKDLQRKTQSKMNGSISDLGGTKAKIDRLANVVQRAEAEKARG